MARSRPSSNDGREPEDRATPPIASDRQRCPVLRPALRERSPRHFSSLVPTISDSAGRARCRSPMRITHLRFQSGGKRRLFNGEEVRRNRRAPCASAGGKHGDDGRSRPESTWFSPAVGDRTIAVSSAVNLRHGHITSVTTSLRLRVGGINSSMKQTDPVRIEVIICVYLCDLWVS